MTGPFICVPASLHVFFVFAPISLTSWPHDSSLLALLCFFS